MTLSSKPNQNPVLESYYAVDYVVSITTAKWFQQLDSAISSIKWRRLIHMSPCTSCFQSWQHLTLTSEIRAVFAYTEPSLETFSVYVSSLSSTTSTLPREFSSSQKHLVSATFEVSSSSNPHRTLFNIKWCWIFHCHLHCHWHWVMALSRQEFYMCSCLLIQVVCVCTMDILYSNRVQPGINLK